MLIIIYSRKNKKELLQWQFRDVLTNGYNTKLWGVILILWPFSRIIVLGLSIGPINIQPWVPGPVKSAKYGFTHEVGFKWLRKFPVTPVALISLWDHWAHPLRTVTSVIHRIHNWIRLVIPFLLKENRSWSPGVTSSACVETFWPPWIRLFSIARWMLLNTSSQFQGFKTLSPCLAPVSACWRSGAHWAVFLVQFPHMASSQVVVMIEELGHVSLVF